MSNRHETLRRRAFVALLCLVLHLCANTPAGLLATAAVAWLDGEHAVQLMGRESGSRIVLAHELENQHRSPVHSHCGTCQVLLLLATPTQAAGPDHILDFREPGVLARNGVAAAPPAPLVDAPLLGWGSFPPVAHFSPVAPLDLPTTAKGRFAGLATACRRDQALPVSLVSTKTTVLLI